MEIAWDVRKWCHENDSSMFVFMFLHSWITGFPFLFFLFSSSSPCFNHLENMAIMSHVRFLIDITVRTLWGVTDQCSKGIYSKSLGKIPLSVLTQIKASSRSIKPDTWKNALGLLCFRTCVCVHVHVCVYVLVRARVYTYSGLCLSLMRNCHSVCIDKGPSRLFLGEVRQNQRWPLFPVYSILHVNALSLETTQKTANW